MPEERKQFIDEARDRLRVWGDELEEFGAEMRDQAGDAYGRTRERLSELGEKLDEAEDMAEDEWEEFKQDMEEKGGDVRDEINMYRDGRPHNRRDPEGK